MTPLARLRRLGPSLVLMLLAGLAVAYLLLVERARPSDAERALRAQSVLPVFRPDELTRIALERPGDALVLARAAAPARDGSAAWSLTAPEAAPAHAAAVEALVGALASASTVRVASPDLPASALGEERAHLELTFVAAGDVKTRARLSLRGPASTPAGSAYVVREDRSVVVAGAELVSELLLPSEHFRDRVLVPYPLTRLARLVATTGARRLQLVRSGTDTFRLADGRRAARSVTDALGVALADLRVERFLPNPAGSAALAAAARQTIELVPADGRPTATLRTGGACPGHEDETIVALDAPVALLGCVGTRALAALLPADDALVETHLFQAKADEVSALDLRVPGAELDLARKGSGWHQRAPVDRDLDPGEADAATALVEALVAAVGTPHPLSTPAGIAARDRLAVLRAGEPAADEELVWSPDAAGAAGAESRELTLSPQVRELLEPTPRTVKALPLWSPSLDPARVAAVDVVTIGCPGHEQRIERRGGAWTLTEPLRTPADQAGVIDLVDAVVHARAERWLDHGGVPGGACPGVALAVGARPLACLAFGADDVAETVQPGALPTYARVTPALAERACRWFVDRHAFALPAEVRDVTLRRGARRALLSRPDPASETDASLEGAASADAFALLDGLVADDVAHLGPPRPEDRLDPPELEVEARVDGGATTRLRFGAVIGSARRATVSGVAAVLTFEAARLEPVFRAAVR